MWKPSHSLDRLVRGFRQPKGGRWRLECPHFRPGVPDLPDFSWATKAVLWGALVALPFLVGWHLTALIPLLGVVVPLLSGTLGSGTQAPHAAQNLSSLVSGIYTAGAVRFAGATVAACIQNAVDAAVSEGAWAVLVPRWISVLGTMTATQGYTGVTFNAGVRMLWEGGPWWACDARAYGADPTGVLDATVAIQAAIDAGPPSFLAAGTYLCSSRGSKLFRISSGGTGTFDYCIDLPSNTRLVVAPGARLKLAAAEANTTVLSNRRTSEAAGSGLDSDIGITGELVIDGNSVAFTDGALVWFTGVTRLSISHLRILNADHSAGYLVDLDEAYFGRLELDTVTGQGWTLGQDATGQEIRDSYIGTVIARNTTTESEPNFPGNPLILAGVRCVIDTIIAENHAAAVKIMRPGTDIEIGQVHLRTGTHASGNSGLTLLGDATTLKRVNVGLVYATAQAGRGLYIDDAEDVAVGSFIGLNNTPSLNFPDVWIAGNRVSIGSILSVGAGQQAVLVRSDAVDYAVGRIIALNPSTQTAGFPAVDVQGGNGTIQSILARDSRGGSALMDRALEVSSAAAVLRVGSVQSTGHTDKPVHFSIAGGDANARVGLGGVVSPAALASGNTNDYTPGDAATLRLSANAAGSTLTGITQGFVGRRLRVVNVSANSLTLAHQSASSAAGNRLLSPTGANIVLAADDVADLEYDDTTDRWRIVNVCQ